MRSITRLAGIFISVFFVIGANGADCPFDPHQVRTSRELWQEISARAELVAPTRAIAEAVTVPGRRRATQPPAYTPPAFTSKNFVDDEIFGKMLQDHIPWTSRSGDAEFLRRVTLDVTGQIPDADAVKAFIADPDPNKRDKMIDTLLASPEYADKWAMWFGDLVQNVQASTATIEYYQGRNAWYAYLRDSIRSGKPYDQMVREQIAGAGKTFSAGEANYWVRQIQNNGPAQDTYDNLSAATGQQFLGMPFICLSCHSGLGHLELVNTSMAKRTRNDFWMNAAFFAQVTAPSVKDAISNSREYTVTDGTGDYRLNTTSGNKTPRTPAAGQSAIVPPQFFLSGEAPKNGETRRAAYARILTAHPQFARAAVNYIWKAIFGIGIVEPADSFDLNRQDPATLANGATLQPTHPQLLTKLAASFIAGNYDLRALIRTIVSSNAYQLSSRYTAGPWSETYAPYYARHYPRRLMAEEVLDAVFKSTGVGGSLTVTGIGSSPRAMQLPDPTEGGSFRTFLNNFGRGNRDDDDRSDDTSIVQALALMNDRTVTDRVKTTATGSKVGALVKATPNDHGAIADALYLNTLGRLPSANERNAAIAYLDSGDLAKKSEDLQFALLNKLEFLFN
jgi:uncharacterized protein DUF1549/uncharacterized protein DUF1553